MCKAGVTTQISSCSGQFSELDMSTTMSWVRFFCGPVVGPETTAHKHTYAKTNASGVAQW